MNKRKRLETLEVVLEALIALLVKREIITREQLEAEIFEEPKESVFTKQFKGDGK